MSDKPMAAAGLTSYRYPSGYGWVMIGARDHEDALREAGRSLESGTPILHRLEIWDEAQRRYVPAILTGEA